MTFAASLVVVAAIGRVLRGEEPADAIEEIRRGAESAANALRASFRGRHSPTSSRPGSAIERPR